MLMVIRSKPVVLLRQKLNITVIAMDMAMTKLDMYTIQKPK